MNVKQGYKNLEVYQRSYQMARRVHEISLKFPSFERMEIAGQIRRAAISIPLNIAEGYSKNESNKELCRFLRMSIGSANEVLVLLDFSKDFNYISVEGHEDLVNQYTQIAKMLQNKKKTPKIGAFGAP